MDIPKKVGGAKPKKEAENGQMKIVILIVVYKRVMNISRIFKQLLLEW